MALLLFEWHSPVSWELPPTRPPGLPAERWVSLLKHMDTDTNELDTLFISYQIGLLLTRHQIGSKSDWPSVFTRMHQSFKLHTVFAFSNKNAMEVA